jgi:hypothetical protein
MWPWASYLTLANLSFVTRKVELSPTSEDSCNNYVCAISLTKGPHTLAPGDSQHRAECEGQRDLQTPISPVSPPHSHCPWTFSWAFYFDLFISVVLGFDFRASHLLGRSSTTWATLPSLLTHFSESLVGQHLAMIVLPLLLLCRDNRNYHHAWLIEMGVSLTFCLLWPRTMTLSIFVSPVSGIIGSDKHFKGMTTLPKFVCKNCVFVHFSEEKIK